MFLSFLFPVSVLGAYDFMPFIWPNAVVLLRVLLLIMLAIV
jgi:hypothetical protein